MAVDQMNGQEIIDLINARLAGYANSVSQDDLLGFANAGKDALWGILKSLSDEYFLIFSQSTSSTGSYYFPPLTTTAREYTLPTDLREVKFIECMTQGFTGLKFAYRNATDEDFRAARRGSNDGNVPSVNPDIMLYTIVGKNQFVLASYPPAALTIQLWYVRSIPDFELDQAVDEIIFPYAKLVADYAAQRIMLATQDPTQFAAWTSAWRADVVDVAQGAGPRNQSDPVFVMGLMENGEDC